MDNARDFVASEGYSFKGREYVRLAHVLDAAIDSNLLSPAELGRLFDKVDAADMSCATWTDYFRLKFFITDHYRGSVPDMATDKDSDARRRGFKFRGSEVFLRQRSLAPILTRYVCRTPDTSIEFSTEVSQPAYFALIPVECLQPSHLNGQPNPSFFLREAQPKDRRDDVSRVMSDTLAQKINPFRLFDCGDYHNCAAFYGAPIVNERGEVVQGNGRAAILRLAFQYYPDSARAYTDSLRGWWGDVRSKGLLDSATPDIPDGHVLVRVLFDKDSPDEFPDSAAITLGQFTDHQVTTGGDTVFDARNVLRILLSEGKLNYFVDIVMKADDDDETPTLDSMITRNYAEAVAWLARHKYITAAENAACLKDRRKTKLQLEVLFEQLLFAGAQDNLPVMFDGLKCAAQTALFSIAHRDLAMPDDKRLLPYIQKSIQAAYEVSRTKILKGAADTADAQKRLANWARQSYLETDGSLAEHGGRYSEFELFLTAIYFTLPRKQIAAKINEIYDRMSGLSNDLFDTSGGKPVPLPDAVRIVTGTSVGGQLGGHPDEPPRTSRDPDDDPEEHGRLLAQIADLLTLRFDHRDKLPIHLTKCQCVEDCAAKFNSSVMPRIGDYANKDLATILSALIHYATFKDELPKLLSPFTR